VLSFIIPYQVISAASPGDIIVVDVGVVPPTIFNQNPAGGTPTIIHQGAPYITPFGVTVEPSTGDLIVADRGAVAIFRQNPDGGAPTIIHQGFPYFGPNGVTIDQATGDIIVADIAAHAIFRQNPAGGMPTVIHSGSPYLGGPVDVAFESSTADVIVAHSDGSIIFRQDLAGGPPSIVCAGTVFDNPESVVVEPSTGDIIVAVFGAAPEATTIYRLNPFAMCDVVNPVDPERIPPPGEQYHGPHGVALEPSTGEIIVVDAILDTVFRQNPAGGNPTIIHSGAPYSFPTDVVVLPVAEDPDTDGDGVPDSTDPDPDDPCNPNPSSTACVTPSCTLSPTKVTLTLDKGESSTIITKLIDCDSPFDSILQTPFDCASQGIDVIFTNPSFPNPDQFQVDETLTNTGGSPGVTHCEVTFEPLFESSGSPVVLVQQVWIETSGTVVIPPKEIVGGEFLPIDSTALVLAGLQTSAIWMLPILVGAAGAGFAAFKLRRK